MGGGYTRYVFFEISVCLGLVTPKSLLGFSLGIGPLCLEFRSRRCSAVGKAHKYCNYVIRFSKIRLFVRVLAIWASWVF